MTSAEIQLMFGGCDDAKILPLWEIAYQLAVMNERHASGLIEDVFGHHGTSIEDSLGSRVGADSHRTVRGGIEGFEPPPASIFSSHRFVKVRGNRFCGHCGAGEHHAIHTADERTTRPDPQAANIQPQGK